MGLLDLFLSFSFVEVYYYNWAALPEFYELLLLLLDPLPTELFPLNEVDIPFANGKARILSTE